MIFFPRTMMCSVLSFIFKIIISLYLHYSYLMQRIENCNKFMSRHFRNDLFLFVHYHDKHMSESGQQPWSFSCAVALVGASNHRENCLLNITLYF